MLLSKLQRFTDGIPLLYNQPRARVGCTPLMERLLMPFFSVQIGLWYAVITLQKTSTHTSYSQVQLELVDDDDQSLTRVNTISISPSYAG